jgi:hypothetical protein
MTDRMLEPTPESAPTPEETAVAEPAGQSFLDYLTDPASRRIEWLALTMVGLFIISALFLTRGDLLAQAVPVLEETEEDVIAEAVEQDLPRRPFRFVDLDLHPDRLFEQYFSGAFFTDGAARTAGGAEGGGISAFEDFRTQLEIYRRRAGEDDNFSIRVYDNRTWRTLEVFTLREQRERYEQTGEANWDRIDALRRAAANQLTAKWTARGIPRDAVSMRWGRYNQILEARQREHSYIEYEIRYARQLGLSLLTTEIGTVETFNQDWLVSPANARGRYQMMPDILDMFGLRTFLLPAATGSVRVRDELHPLLSLLGSFQLVRGYSNAVGHEIPGVSAYHTGPGNIFVVYQNFLRAHAGRPEVRNSTVTQAYMWGVTSGFDRIWAQSSFGPASRGYVLSAYGALRAVEEEPIDPDKTLRTERVQLNAGQQITLQELLQLLEPHEARLDWGYGVDAGNPYERFRRLNTHIEIPASGNPDQLLVPAAGNVRLTAAVGGSPLRFFVPYGASEVLERIRPGLLNSAYTFRFDENSFANPAVTGEKTQADHDYDELVRDISNFGFTNSNRNRLERIYRQFVQLAQDDASLYRDAQLRIITIHRRVWQTRRFNELAATVENVIGARQTAAG